MCLRGVVLTCLKVRYEERKKKNEKKNIKHTRFLRCVIFENKNVVLPPFIEGV